MTKLLDLGSALLDKLRDLLQGEPLRAISYGAAVIIYFVAKAVGSIPDVSFDDAIVQAGAAAAVVISITEFARRYVYSPKTVATIATASSPVAAALNAGVDANTVVNAIDLDGGQ